MTILSEDETDLLNPDVKRQLLLEMYMDFAGDAGEDGWVWEQTRWYELAHSILSAAVEEHEFEIDPTRCTESLIALQLLEIDDLSVDPTRVDALRLALDAAGFEGIAGSVATDLHNASVRLAHGYDGKLQRLLRGYAEELIPRLRLDLDLEDTAINDAAIRRWFQATMNQPVVQTGGAVRRARQVINLTVDDIVAIADADDLNLGIVDETLKANAAGFKALMDSDGDLDIEV